MHKVTTVQVRYCDCSNVAVEHNNLGWFCQFCWDHKDLSLYLRPSSEEAKRIARDKDRIKHAFYQEKREAELVNVHVETWEEHVSNLRFKPLLVAFAMNTGS